MQVKIEESWRSQLQEEFDKPYFARLAAFVREEYRTQRVCPVNGDLFRVFNLCPFDRVRVVILGQDPYPDPRFYYGICFSVPDGVPIPGSLQNIFREVHDDTGRPVPASGRLERWVAQGVLSMNTIFTTRAFRSGSHRGRGWEEFSDAVIRRLNERRDHLVFLLWGPYTRRRSRSTADFSAAAISAAPTPTCARTASPKSNGDTMKPAKKKTAACPAALRLEAMLPVDAGILSQQADDWTDRSVERGTVGPLAAEHALWHNCLFRNVTFTDCRLHGAQLSDIRFEGCDLSNLALDGAALNRVEFVGCKLLGAALPDATLNHVRLGRCNGRYLNLSGSRLRQVRFTECDLTEAALNDCRLDGVAFEGCTLRSTEFSHTPLRGIDLRQSQLGDLRLTVDDLRGAIVAPSQALDLLPLLGVVVRTQTAEETE